MKKLLLLLLATVAYAQQPAIRDESCITASGSGTAYACNIFIAPTSYTASAGTTYLFRFQADVSNTGAATINFNSLGAKAITKSVGGITTPLVAGDIRAGQWVYLTYDGTRMQMASQTGNSISGDIGGLTYDPTGGLNSQTLQAYLSGQYYDIRNFGAVGITGNCHASTVDYSSNIQAALNQAGSVGPGYVYVPPNFCFPIGSHIWIPQNVTLFGSGRTTGYEISSSGSLIIANANFNGTATFPFNMMVWQSGDNFTSGTFVAHNLTYANRIEKLEINANGRPSAGGIFRVGAQEKSGTYKLIISGWSSYGLADFGVDCNNQTAPSSGCLINYAHDVVANPGSGQDGPDDQDEFFPAIESGVASSASIPFFGMGLANYKGLSNTTINGAPGGTTVGCLWQGYAWGSNFTMGPGLHSEGCTDNHLYIGTPVGYANRNGADHSSFKDIDGGVVIGNVQSQSDLTFENVGNAGITNNIVIESTATNLADTSGFYDAVTGAYQFPIFGSNRAGNYPFINAYAILGAYAGSLGAAPWSGVNLQNIERSDTALTRGFIGANIYFDTGSSTWKLGGDGGTDYSALAFLNHGIGLSLNKNVASSTLTTTQFFSNIPFVVSYDDMSVLVGTALVNSDGTLNTNGKAFQVYGDASVSGATTLNNLTVTGTCTGCGGGSGTGITGIVGDMTTPASSSGNGVVSTFATVNSNVGTFGSSTQSVTITTNAKGLITAISQNAISGGGGSTATAITSGTTAAIPATCSVGQIYFATDATAGQNQYDCTATNIWTQVVSLGGSGCLAYTGGSLDIVTSCLPRLAAVQTFTGLTGFNSLKLVATGTPPACSVTGDIGNAWLDNTSSVTTHLKMCAAVASAETFVQIF